MRREDYEIFFKRHPLGLVSDCLYYCFQTEQISEDEYVILDKLIDDIYHFYLDFVNVSERRLNEI